MAWKYLGGKSRRYENTVTGEQISRRQYDKLMSGISYEKKAKENREKSLKTALSRPARGRTKAQSDYEATLRLEAAREAENIRRERALNKRIVSKKRSAKPPKIRPQLLKTGKIGRRISFSDWGYYDGLVDQMLSQKLKSGRRLIAAYAIGVEGFDEASGRDLTPTLFPLMSPKVRISEDEALAALDVFTEAKPYFVFSNWWIHLHFDLEYAEYRKNKGRSK